MTHSGHRAYFLAIQRMIVFVFKSQRDILPNDSKLKGMLAFLSLPHS